MAAIGRPKEPVPEDVAAEVLQWISEGKTLRDFCRQEGKPCRATIDNWRNKDDAFASRFARARDVGFDVIAEETVSIADDGTNDYTKREDPKTGRTYTAFDAEHVQRSKLRIETRLKLLAKWDPRRYGDRQHVEHSGKVDLGAEIEAARQRIIDGRKEDEVGDEPS